MRWIVVQVKSQHEERAVRNLEETGFRCFFPKLLLQKGDKLEKRPMFVGYIFVEIEPEDMPMWRTIKHHRGVIQILGSKSGNPAYLPSGFVERMIESGDVVEDQGPSIKYAKGQKIKFTSGPFLGITGIVHWNNNQQVALLVDILGTNTIVQTSVHIISPE
jgi:transcriptional antiterminator RfaH